LGATLRPEAMSTSLDTPISASRLHLEARKARRRFLPATVFYTAYSLGVLALALRSAPRRPVLLWFAGGMVAWTLLEYAVHRYVLHGRFPAGRTLYRRLTHRYFDHLHWEHHARPWDSGHVNGTLRDTLPFSAVLIGLSCLAPLRTGPVLVAGLLMAYVVEEWIHQAVHFYDFDNRYFRYIRRHHLYHHSPRGMNAGYGLTSGFWDAVWDTRFPPEERHALHGRPRRRPRRPGPAKEVPAPLDPLRTQPDRPELR
jgi:sterol desaturase/sphingolipid hydroxylase (fatty acid hydroxylase superfamily)